MKPKLMQQKIKIKSATRFKLNGLKIADTDRKIIINSKWFHKKWLNYCIQEYIKNANIELRNFLTI